MAIDWSVVQKRFIDPYSDITSENASALTKAFTYGTGRGITNGFTLTLINPTSIKVTKGVLVKDGIVIEFTQDVTIDLQDTNRQPGMNYVVVCYEHKVVTPPPIASIDIIATNVYNPDLHLILGTVQVNTTNTQFLSVSAFDREENTAVKRTEDMSFLEFSDTPATYSNYASYGLVVNSTEDGLAYLNLDATYLRLDGLNSPNNNISFNGHRIVNLGDGQNASDAINKGQLDTQVALLQAADANLQNSINNEATQRQAADNNLQQNLNTEIQSRQSADLNLQNQIDNIINSGVGHADNADTLDGYDSTYFAPSTHTHAFTDLTDVPSTYTANKFVAVNASGTGLTFVDAPSSSGGATSFLGLSDVPYATYSGYENYIVRVNSAGTELEFIDPSTLGGSSGSSTFIGLTDTPSYYDNTVNGYVLTVDSNNNKIKFTSLIDITNDMFFINLQDTPSSYSGYDGYVVTVDATNNRLVFTDPSTFGGSSGGASTFIGLTDTPSSYPTISSNEIYVPYVDSNALSFKELTLTDLQDVDLVSNAPDNGNVLTYDSSTDKWIPAVPGSTSNAYLPLSGGTMSGTIYMDGNNIDMQGGSILNVATNSITFEDGTTVSASGIQFAGGGQITSTSIEFANGNKIRSDLFDSDGNLVSGAASLTELLGINDPSSLEIGVVPRWDGSQWVVAAPDTTLDGGSGGNSSEPTFVDVGLVNGDDFITTTQFDNITIRFKSARWLLTQTTNLPSNSDIKLKINDVYFNTIIHVDENGDAENDGFNLYGNYFPISNEETTVQLEFHDSDGNVIHIGRSYTFSANNFLNLTLASDSHPSVDISDITDRYDIFLTSSDPFNPQYKVGFVFSNEVISKQAYISIVNTDSQSDYYSDIQTDTNNKKLEYTYDSSHAMPLNYFYNTSSQSSLCFPVNSDNDDLTYYTYYTIAPIITNPFTSALPPISLLALSWYDENSSQDIIQLRAINSKGHTVTQIEYEQFDDNDDIIGERVTLDPDIVHINSDTYTLVSLNGSQFDSNMKKIIFYVKLDTTAVAWSENYNFSNNMFVVNYSHYFISSVLYTTSSMFSDLCYADSHIWAVGDDHYVAKLSLDGNVITTYNIGHSASKIYYYGSYLWIASYGDDVVLQLSLDGTILATYNVTSPSGLCFDGTNIWVTSYEEDFVAILGQNGQILNTYNASAPSDIIFDGTNLWIGQVYHTTKMSLQGTVLAQYSHAAHALCFDGTYVWIADYGGRKIEKQSLDGNIVFTYSTAHNPSDVMFDGTDIWFTTYVDNKVTRLSLDGNLLGSYPSGGNVPQGLCFDGTSVWVTNYGSHSIKKFTK